MKQYRRKSALFICATLILVSVQFGCATQLPEFEPSQSAQASPPASPELAESAPMSPEALDQLVAPIALYPDALVAQVLAASTYPAEIVEAHRWLQALGAPRELAPLELTGVISTIAHLAYHFGAIRQINKKVRVPKEGTFNPST